MSNFTTNFDEITYGFPNKYEFNTIKMFHTVATFTRKSHIDYKTLDFSIPKELYDDILSLHIEVFPEYTGCLNQNMEVISDKSCNIPESIKLKYHDFLSGVPPLRENMYIVKLYFEHSVSKSPTKLIYGNKYNITFYMEYKIVHPLDDSQGYETIRLKIDTISEQ